MNGTPWDQRIARILVKPLVSSPVTPNQLTLFAIAVALAGAGLLASGVETLMNWGAGLFVLSRFMDHFDGELARQKGMTSKLGYYLDYAGGGISYGALYLGLGLGLRHGALGDWALVLGVAGAVCAVVSVFINLGIDRRQAAPEGDSVGYPGFAGFELEDGIYLLAPVTWLGYVMPLFVASAIGAVVYTLWSLWCLLRLKGD